MLSAIELSWFRCRDGYRLQEPAVGELEAYDRAKSHAAMLGGPREPVSRIVPVSDVREPYYAAGDLSQASATEGFLRTEDNLAAILKYYSEFGPLRPPRSVTPGERQHEVWFGPEWENGEPLSDWRKMRENVDALLNDIKEKSMVAAARLFDMNKLGVTRLGIRKDQPSEKWRTILQPDSLSHLIWLELGLTVTGGAKIRPCQVCNKPMLIGGATGGKENRRTCSAKCRFSAFQQRKAGRSRVL